MIQLIRPVARSIAAAGLIGTALLASPLWAAFSASQGAPTLLAQADTAAKPDKKARQSPTERVEARIKSLHDRLNITAAQETQWAAVADAMRDNAKTMEAAIQQREAAKSMTAVDDLKAYQAIADAHAQGLQKLIPAFDALYASMSDDQKKNADTVFSQGRHHRRGHK